MNNDLIHYYSERAKEYEVIYEKPERQDDLSKIKVILKELFTDKSVFEIACGTGYWTQVISETAKSILAVDINESVLDIAKTKGIHCPTTFSKADIAKLPTPAEHFDSLFGGFIWSHIPKQTLVDFLREMKNVAPKGSIMVFLDNQYVEGSSTPIADTDEHGNTYQVRNLGDGTSHRVMKNFPNDTELMEAIRPFGENIVVDRLPYYWMASYIVK